ncbi:S-adenosyl-L-methionine-dependent methyltransferase [Xylaria palmicola]|nr:S-adenosyl-L-methionine-dependent methyltransferase [Xylaria palmicola]
MTNKQESTYWMESEGERKRLASNHLIAKDAMDGKLVRAPIDFSQPRKILDSGTADGTWLLDLAFSLPDPVGGSHEFVGTDLNPASFPKSIPPNMTFTVQDIKKPWPELQHGSFDLVHQRLTLLGAGHSPSASITHLYNITKPGGWLQISEGTMEFPPDIVNEERTPAYNDMLKLMRAIAGAIGAEWHIGKTLKGLLEEAGFTDIEEEDVVLSMGRTNTDEQLAKEGAESCRVAIQGLSKFAKNFAPENQPLPMARYDSLGPQVETELMEKGAVYPLKVVWGRKPE